MAAAAAADVEGIDRWSSEAAERRWRPVEGLWPAMHAEDDAAVEGARPSSGKGGATAREAELWRKALVLRRTALHDHGTVSSRGASGEWDVAMVYGEADPRVLWDLLARAAALWRDRKSADLPVADSGMAAARARAAARSSGPSSEGAAGAAAAAAEPPLPAGGARGTLPPVQGAFVDIGSGAGRAVAAAAALGAFDSCRGIEVDKLLHEAACAALEAVAASREAGGGLPSAAEASAEAPAAAKASFPAGCGWSAVELFLGDFRQSAALGDAGVVFVTATTFPPALMAALARACERLKPGAVVVSTGQRVVSPLLEDAGECRRAMPWGASTVYFSRRARGGRWLAGVLRR